MRFQAGDYLVDVVVDIDRFELPATNFLPGITADTIEFARTLLEPDHIDATRNRLMLAIQSFVLHAGGRTILLDSCVGEDKERRLIPEFHRRARTGFLDGLARIGVPAELVDVVFCTHLHIDHVGWNTRLHDGRWCPRFPMRATSQAGASSSTGSNRIKHPAAMQCNCRASKTACGPFSRQGCPIWLMMGMS